MKHKLITSDIDGKLLEVSENGKPNYCKQLSVDTAWHVYDVNDLVNLPDSIIQSLDTDLTENVYHINYKPGLKLLDLPLLRKLIPANTSLTLWRTALILKDLCRQLKILHEEEIPQMLIHPGRIGEYEGKIVLIPTLSGILPPLSDMPSNEIAGWLHYVAPEVLRTRGIQKDLLYKGDIYSLGRLLGVLCAPWQPDSKIDRFVLAEQVVESSLTDIVTDWPAELELFRNLYMRMCDKMPEKRPGIDQILSELDDIMKKFSPTSLFQACLARNDLEQANIIRQDLEETYKEHIFQISPALVYQMNADLALKQKPPNYNLAISELNNVEMIEPDINVYIQIGRVYTAYTEHPQHLMLGSEAYRKAVLLALSRKKEITDLMNEWIVILEQFKDWDMILDTTKILPKNVRNKNLVLLRTDCLLKKNNNLDAWYEISNSFPFFKFDESLYAKADQVARKNTRVNLVSWMENFKDKPGFAAPTAIVCKIYVDMNLEKPYLQKAKAYKPSA